jgi:8-oxo-dGTP pyrophosphatase MutT (NUDIX family)
MLSITGTLIKQALTDIETFRRNRFPELFTPPDIDRFRPSAVIMPLIWNEGEWHLLFTHRSHKLTEHSGQVSFPGGALEHSDRSLQDTALREMQEEIGILTQDVEVFGSLGEMPVITGYLVRVFVGQIPWPYELKVNHDEVENVFTIPLCWLADPDHRVTRYRSYAGREIPVIFFDLYQGYQLWGASAEMTVTLLDALKLLS